jgi:hypothetical protein
MLGDEYLRGGQLKSGACAILECGLYHLWFKGFLPWVFPVHPPTRGAQLWIISTESSSEVAQ